MGWYGAVYLRPRDTQGSEAHFGNSACGPGVAMRSFDYNGGMDYIICWPQGPSSSLWSSSLVMGLAAHSSTGQGPLPPRRRGSPWVGGWIGSCSILSLQHRGWGLHEGISAEGPGGGAPSMYVSMVAVALLYAFQCLRSLS